MMANQQHPFRGLFVQCNIARCRPPSPGVAHRSMNCLAIVSDHLCSLLSSLFSQQFVLLPPAQRMQSDNPIPAVGQRPAPQNEVSCGTLCCPKYACLHAPGWLPFISLSPTGIAPLLFDICCTLSICWEMSGIFSSCFKSDCIWCIAGNTCKGAEPYSATPQLSFPRLPVPTPSLSSCLGSLCWRTIIPMHSVLTLFFVRVL